MKTAIIDVGGGMRGIYAAGVFDRCMDEKRTFDLCIGVSAGAANVVAFLANQRGRNYRFYAKYPSRKEYMSLGNFLISKSYLDLNYVYGTLSNSDGEDPVDFETFEKNPSELMVVACNAITGEAKYFGKQDFHKDDYSVLKASSAIPVVCHPYGVDGTLYYDGALADPVPVDKALECGCDRVILILTKPREVRRTDTKDRFLAGLMDKHYEKAAERLRERAKLYNDSVDRALEYEKQGKLLIIAPESTEGADTLTKDKEILHRLYLRGYADGEKIDAFLKA